MNPYIYILKMTMIIFQANNEGIRSLKNYSDNEWVQDIYSSENQNKTIWYEQRTYNKIADLI